MWFGNHSVCFTLVFADIARGDGYGYKLHVLFGRNKRLFVEDDVHRGWREEEEGGRLDLRHDKDFVYRALSIYYNGNFFNQCVLMSHIPTPADLFSYIITEGCPAFSIDCSPSRF